MVDVKSGAQSLILFSGSVKNIVNYKVSALVHNYSLRFVYENVSMTPDLFKSGER